MNILDTGFQGIAHYDFQEHGIRLNLAADRANKYRATFHEIGHLLDRFMEYKSVAYKNGLFAKTLRSEAARHSENFGAVSRRLRKIPLEIRHEISDIWHGTTNGKVNGGFGHYEPDYRTKEAFAHMLRATIQSSESLALIKHYFPKSYEVFEALINEFIGGVA